MLHLPWRRVFLAAVIVFLALFAVAGSSRLDGPLLFSVSGTHGVHASDVPVALLALLALLVV